LFICTLFTPENLYAQSSHSISIKGRLSDASSGNGLYQAALFLLSHADTIAGSFSGKKGEFFFSLTQPSDTFILLTGHPRYFSRLDTITIIEKQETDLGNLHLFPVPLELEEIVIEGGYTSKIGRDTAKFKADSFKVRNFASAWELLGRIPGIQMIPGGTITYNGSPINEISIDGVPFLNFDQGRLLQLLRGRDLDVIKIYTNKSSKARLTGIDDLHKGKGIDLVLKEEARHGYFGKIAGSAGSGNPIKWDNSSNISSFTEDYRITAFVNANNTGNTSDIGDQKPIENQEGLQEPLRGLPRELAGGIHYDRGYFKDKRLLINVNYSFNNTAQALTSLTHTTYTLPGSRLISDATSVSKSNTFAHSLCIQANYRITSDSYLNIALNSGLNHATVSGKSTSTSTDSNFLLLNSSSTDNKVISTSPLTFFNLTYLKTFGNPQRTLSVSFAPNWTFTNKESHQNTTLRTANSNAVQDIAQRKEERQTVNNYALYVNYTEPLGQNISLSLNLQSDLGLSTSDNQIFDKYAKADNTEQDTLNSLYSNYYRFGNTTTRLNPALQLQLGKTTISAGVNLSYLSWKQTNENDNSRSVRVFTNFLPSLTASTPISAENFISLGYKIDAAQPGLSQLQPLINNNDPLHLLIGNPDLVQSMTHSITGGLSGGRSKKNKYYNIAVSFSYVKGAITLDQSFNTDGLEVSRYYNQDGDFYGSLALNYDCKLASKLRLALNGAFTTGKTNNTINNTLNNALTQQYNSSFALRYTLDTTLSLNCSMAFNYRINWFSADPNTNNRILGTKGTLNINYNMPWDLVIVASFDWTGIYGANTEGKQLNVIRCNAYAGKYLRKDQAVLLKLFAYDILNQNKGYTIYNENSSVTETSFTTLTRYIMLGLLWNFTKR
jgi:hypothetical protein